MSNRNRLVKTENANDSSLEEDEAENNEESTDTSDSE